MLYFLLQLLFIVILLGYVLRMTVFRGIIVRYCGKQDTVNELAHASCALLMIPMVMKSGSNELFIWNAAIIFALGWTVFFVSRAIMNRHVFGNLAHALVFAGTALMYVVHHHPATALLGFLFWLSGWYYFAFSVHYAENFWRALHEQAGMHRVLVIQSELAHIAIGLVMSAMVFYPHIFMV